MRNKLGFCDSPEPDYVLLLLYPLCNHPRCESRLSGSRKLSSRIVLTGLSHTFLGVKAVRRAVQLNIMWIHSTVWTT